MVSMETKMRCIAVSMETVMSHQPQSAISSLESHLGFWLRYVSNHVSSRFHKLLEEQGASVTEWVALRTLFESTATTHTELIQALGMTKGATSKVVSRLEEKGLVSRQQAEYSAREQILILTEQGKALVPRLATLADENDAHFFDYLSTCERDALMKTLQQFVAQHQLQSVPVT